QNCLDFYWYMWSVGYLTLAHLVQDPRGFIFDAIERAIMDRW
ncbi:unnamed protein product, partial [marine sediment metagenome]